MSTNRYTDKEDVAYIYKTEYYSVTNKDEILPLATMWMNLEGIMLSKISHRKIDILLPLVQFKK